MTTWIALFRGINVGGNSMLPMKSLVSLLQGLGCVGVKTYIQSGNAVFRASSSQARQLAARIGGAIQKRHRFQPRVLLLNVKELQQAVAANPFPKAEAIPKSLHLYFLSEAPGRPDLTR